jgi:glycerophosphoryl diester phosphodiesterase
VRRPIFGGGPTVIGHRGCGTGAPAGCRENTVASLLAAVEHGVDWVELDVHRCADGFVLVHEAVASDGSLVLQRGVDDLRGVGLDSLTDLLAALPPWVGVDIDVKSSIEDALAPPDRTTSALLAPVLAEELGRRPLLVTSFDPAVLLEVRAAVPAVPLGLLTWTRFPVRIAVAAAARLGVEVVGLHTGSLGAEIAARASSGVLPEHGRSAVEVAHAAGLEVLVWCPNAAAVEPLVEAGVDAVVIDSVAELAGAIRVTRSASAR